MSTIKGNDYHQFTFSNLESQIAKDYEIRFIDAFVEEFISSVRGAKARELTGGV
jgi:hypothetical protein